MFARVCVYIVTTLNVICLPAYKKTANNKQSHDNSYLKYIYIFVIYIYVYIYSYIKKKRGGGRKAHTVPVYWPVYKPRPHSMTSPGATVTSCSGISWLPRRSWAPAADWRMRVVPSAVMMVSLGGGDNEEEATPFLFWWVFICLARWSLRMNLFEHCAHTNFFSPGKRNEREKKR